MSAEHTKRKVVPADVYEVHQIVARLCRLQDLVSDEVFGYEYASDCFCGEGGVWPLREAKDYRNDYKAIEFIENAVASALEQEKAKA